MPKHYVPLESNYARYTLNELIQDEDVDSLIVFCDAEPIQKIS